MSQPAAGRESGKVALLTPHPLLAVTRVDGDDDLLDALTPATRAAAGPARLTNTVNRTGVSSDAARAAASRRWSTSRA